MKETALRINAYLKRFEADPAINKAKDAKRTQPYWHSCAWSQGRYIGVRYVSFQGQHFLSRGEAEQYLAFLDGGGIGKHFRSSGVSGPTPGKGK